MDARPLDATAWRRASALFDAALDVEIGERKAWLEVACAGDTALHDRLARWLAADALTRGFLELPVDATPAFADAADEVDDTPVDLTGARIGEYRALRRIGRGGMGEVWLAERVDGEFEQRVAIKRLLYPTPELVSRFRRERNVLAGLQHPHIAQLFGGGVGADGAPYIVMERVDGVPLTEFCAQALDLERRVTLFLQICAAVDHAHRNLIVHRDLKPSNILVTADGRVKLLDFGIAKLLDTTPIDGDPLTRVQRLTPEYAAPEQMAGARITTATDIYTLGVLLCEMLTGKRPFRTPGNVDRASLATAREALAPSVIAAAGHDAFIPARRLRGDLDRIALRALASEPERRYASVAALADDLRRHLQGRPILAAGDRRGYRVRKFLRRNRVASAAAGAVALALIAGAAIAVWQAQRATAQARFAASQQAIARTRAISAERIKQFMIGLFAASDPAVAQGTMPRADDLLASGSARIAAELADQPLVQAELYDAMAMSYIGLNNFDQAEHLLDQASRLLIAERTPDTAALRARVELHRGSASAELGHYAAALAALNSAEAALRSSGSPDAQDLAHVATVRAWVERDLGHLHTSESVLREAFAALVPEGASMNDGAARTLNNLAYTLELLGRERESIGAYERVMAWRERHDGAADPARLWTAYTFAKSLRAFGHAERARDLLERIRPAMLKVLGAEHSDLAGVDIVLGQTRMDLGDLSGGHALVVDAVSRSHRVARRNALWANAEMALGEADYRIEDRQSAREHFTAARAVWVDLAGVDVPAVRICDSYLAALAIAERKRNLEETLVTLQAIADAQRVRSEGGLRSTLALLADSARRTRAMSPADVEIEHRIASASRHRAQ